MQLGAVAEDDLVIAAEQRAQFADAIDIDDDGPADARKDPWVEPGLEAALAADRGADSATPSFVVLQAGELNAPPASRSIGTPNGRAAPADFATYAAIRQLGRSGIAGIVERCSDCARALTLGIGRLPGAEVLWEPVINQGLMRFLDPSGRSHDRRTDEVIAAILASGEAFFGGVTWRGMRAMRISVCNWMTSEGDVGRVIRAVERAMETGG